MKTFLRQPSCFDAQPRKCKELEKGPVKQPALSRGSQRGMRGRRELLDDEAVGQHILGTFYRRFPPFKRRLLLVGFNWGVGGFDPLLWGKPLNGCHFGG